MIAEALQECLSHFPKIETLGKEQRVSKKVSSLWVSDVIAT